MKKKLLVIDDDYDIVEPLAMLFQSEGYSVLTITKGEETYKEVQRFQPDLILLDVLLSGKDGRTICKNFKKDKATKHIPIILMSAHPSAARDFSDNCADAFIAKPFETDELITLVKKTLNRRS